jgi:ferredoxin-NADP reductase
VLREPQGRGGSAYVHDHLREGTAVRVRGPRNNFPLRPAARHLFIAGGVGITPILPMVEAAEAAGADWRLLYGGRTRTSMAFLDRLAPHGDRVLVRPQDEYGLLDLAAHLGVPEEGTLVHACGPEPLLQAVQEHCGDWPAGTLGVERFAPVPTAAIGVAEAFEVELARSGLTLTVARLTARSWKPWSRPASRWTSPSGKARAVPARPTYSTASPTIATRC